MTTIRDVARRADVSIKTVSRVINSEPMVATLTRDRVIAAMEEMAYEPNALAQRLARGRSMVLGLLFNNATWTYLDDVFESALEVARGSGYGILIHHLDARLAVDRAAVLNMAAQRHVEGFIFTPPCDNVPELLKELEERDVPFVRLTPHDRQLPLPHVTASDCRGAQGMTQHLLSLGHRKIAFVMGNPDHQASHDRLAGYRDALQGQQVEFDSSLVEQGDWSFESGVDCGGRLIDASSPPTAIFASNDDMAAGVLSAAHRMGFQVPQELSVAGFDDVPLAQQVWPPLTTVRQPIREIARLATGLLIDLVAGKPPSVLHQEIPTELVIRESTCEPASRA